MRPRCAVPVTTARRKGLGTAGARPREGRFRFGKVEFEGPAYVAGHAASVTLPSCEAALSEDLLGSSSGRSTMRSTSRQRKFGRAIRAGTCRAAERSGGVQVGQNRPVLGSAEP